MTRPFLLQAVRYFTVLASFLYGAGSPSTAFCEILVFRDQSAFFQAATIVSTENFDQYPTRQILGIGTATVDGVTYTSSDPLALWQIQSVFLSSSPPNYLVGGNIDQPAAVLTLGEDGFTNAIGFFLIPPAFIPPPAYQIIVTAVDGDQLSDM